MTTFGDYMNMLDETERITTEMKLGDMSPEELNELSKTCSKKIIKFAIKKEFERRMNELILKNIYDIIKESYPLLELTFSESSLNIKIYDSCHDKFILIRYTVNIECDESFLQILFKDFPITELQKENLLIDYTTKYIDGYHKLFVVDESLQDNILSELDKIQSIMYV
jgi:hypothetical protein